MTSLIEDSKVIEVYKDDEEESEISDVEIYDIIRNTGKVNLDLVLDYYNSFEVKDEDLFRII